MFKENVKMSFRNIWSNKMRSFLTVLGIIIGVASIIALISITQGVTKSVGDSFEALGSNRIQVSIAGIPSKKGITENDLHEISNIENIDGVSPAISMNVNAAYDNTLYSRGRLYGRNEVYFKKVTNLFREGRTITAVDCIQQNNVCLIGQEVADSLFFGVTPIGKDIFVNGVSFKIIGILMTTGDYSLSNYNRFIIVPYTSAMRVMNTGYINSFDIYIKNPDLNTLTINQINLKLSQMFNYSKTGYQVSNMQDMADMVQKVSVLLTFMLVCIAGISLLVGGIGIMNIMLVSVTERTSEIGLRKALGADPKVIRQQFLLEALFLSLIGGAIGLVTGILIALVVSLVIGSFFMVSVYTILVAFIFSCGIGIIFGYFPARKASMLNPIDALRSV